jgi:hypothetical protein
LTDSGRYLQDLPLYEKEKPYWCLLPPHEGFDPDEQRVDNLEFETRDNIKITDIRPFKDAVKLEDRGFTVLSHPTQISEFTAIKDVDAYKSETEKILQHALGGVFVKCYDLILRKNVIFRRSQMDLNDQLHTEGPARGAHNGITSLIAYPAGAKAF